MADTPSNETIEQEPNGAEQEVDWEAKYREAIKHSRQWEDRAKANKEKADAFDKLEDEKKSELEKATERIAALEKEVDGFRSAEEVRKARDEVARETGVDPSLLRGATREELEAHAAQLAAFLGSQKAKVPTDKGGAKTPPAITVEEIEKIPDQMARVRARAEHIELYRH